LEPPPDPAPSSEPLAAGPLVWEVLGNKIYSVPGSDGSFHLAYVAVFTNESRFPVTVKSMEVLDPDHNNQLTGINQILSVLNEDVTGQLRLFSLPQTFDQANFSTQIGPGQSAAAYFDVTYRDRDAIPQRLAHRVSTFFITPDGQEQDFVVTDDSVPVSPHSAIVLSPPLRGGRWVNANGCCKQIGPHRGTLNPINGALRPAEVFAIDFVQVNQQGLGFTGDGSKVRDYPYYGTDILAAGAGTVTEVVRDLPDQVPGNAPPATIETTAGNHVIIDMGGEHYALYAHMVPNSPTVQVGDVVSPGQRIGLLGNSGSTTAPHLHFQVMDSASALKAHGLPFVFDKMRLQGEIADSVNGAGEKFSDGIPLPIRHDHRALLQGAMPLTLDVLNFK
ncbi:MAG: M23 family metallopeptidase, partial [Bryobacteraceae bacterium]